VGDESARRTPVCRSRKYFAQESRRIQPSQFLPELLGSTQRTSLQAQLCALRVLFELLRFLLKSFRLSAVSYQYDPLPRRPLHLTPTHFSIYNGCWHTDFID
jgi:hypothetical protein